MPDLTKPDHTLVAVLEDGQARVLRVPTAYDPERRRMRPVIDPAPGRRVFWRGAEILADGTAVPGPSPWWGPWSVVEGRAAVGSPRSQGAQLVEGI